MCTRVSANPYVNQAVDRWKNVTDVRYEDVVRDTEIQTRRILAHIGLDWDDACLRYFEGERPIRTASIAQVRQPIYHHSVRRWRPAQEDLAPLITALAGG